jgi:hypothetical protein
MGRKLTGHGISKRGNLVPKAFGFNILLSPKVGGARPSAQRPYHHGSLRETMLRAAESILERNGIGGLTLRAAAREAGAPKNNFGSFSADVSQRASRFHPTGVAVRGSSVEEDFIRSVVDW